MRRTQLSDQWLDVRRVIEKNYSKIRSRRRHDASWNISYVHFTGDPIVYPYTLIQRNEFHLRISKLHFSDTANFLENEIAPCTPDAHPNRRWEMHTAILFDSTPDLDRSS